MAWGELISIGLKLILALVGWAQDKQLLQAGQDREIAKNALAILDRTETGKKLREKINALPDDDLDKLTDDLGS